MKQTRTKQVQLCTEQTENNDKDTVEVRMLEHLGNHENMFETGVVRANEC